MRNRIVGRTLIALFASAVAITGCTDRELKPLHPCIVSNVTLPVNPEGLNQVDLLIVNDSSRSMLAEQQALAAAIPELIEILTAGNPPEGSPDHNPSLSEFDPVNMHVGVTNVDLGLLDPAVAELYSGSTCDVRGNDGVLLTESLGSDCVPELLDPAEGRFLRFVPGETNEAEFVSDFACLANVGTDGCFIEQQLEASLKAVTPADSSIEFYGGTTGQGAGAANDGFVRDNSLLAVILVTDEDDCSMQDPSIHASGAELGPYPGGINPRCFLDRNSNALHPLQRYVDGFAALKHDPSHVVYSVITGIPTELSPAQGENMVDFYDRVLSHGEMELQLVNPGGICLSGECNDTFTGCENDTDCSWAMQDFNDPIEGPVPAASLDDTEVNNLSTVWPTCRREIPGELLPGIADPGRRLVRAARAMESAGIQTLVSSICNEDPSDPSRLDFSGAINDIARIIASTLAGACLPRPLNPRPDGTVPCEVIETQPPGVDCDPSRGRVPTDPPRMDGDRVVCAIEQVLLDFSTDPPTEPAEPGWYYDEYIHVGDCPEGQEHRISFTAGAEPTLGATVRLECLQNVQGSGGTIALGGPCGSEEPAGGGCEGAGADSCCSIPQFMGDRPAECNPGTNTCMVPCSNTADCRASGLQAFSCDDREDEPTFGYCVLPTCQS